MKAQGFALLIGLLLLLILTVCGVGLLLLAGSYYSSVHNLFEIENAKISTGAAIKYVVDRHNMEEEEPRFFLNPQSWQGNRLAPFEWNGYRINAEAVRPWSSIETNVLTFIGRKGPFVARKRVGLAQRRLEHFALYTDVDVTLNGPSLIEGLVRVGGAITFLQPGVLFRNVLQAADLSPSWYAIQSKITLQSLNYPMLSDWISLDFFRNDAFTNGLIISSADPLFWKGDHYELDFRFLDISLTNNRWKVQYKGSELCQCLSPHLYFDADLTVSQPSSRVPFYSPRPYIPLYITSASRISIDTAISSFDSGNFIHPLAFIAPVVRLTGDLPQAARIQGLVLSLGPIIVEPGFSIMSEGEKNTVREEILRSVFVLEPEKKIQLIQALDSNQKIVWFRGSVASAGGLLLPSELREVHFECSKLVYPLLPSFQFVYLVEGEERWL